MLQVIVRCLLALESEECVLLVIQIAHIEVIIVLLEGVLHHFIEFQGVTRRPEINVSLRAVSPQEVASLFRPDFVLNLIGDLPSSSRLVRDIVDQFVLSEISTVLDL